jgi:glutamate dehydrogenase
VLKGYFPQVLSERFANAIDQHPLKREIIATFVTNTVVNRTGATFVNFLAAEAAANTADVVRAYTLAREIFDLEPLWDQIDVLDGQVASSLQLDLLCKLIAIAQRASRWILRSRFKHSDLPTLMARYQPGARELRANLQAWLPAPALGSWEQSTQQLVQAGVAEDLARNLTALDFIFPAMDVVDLTTTLAHSTLAQVAQTYFGIDGALGLTAWRTQINRLPTESLWQTQARGSARDDVYAIASQITLTVLSKFESMPAWSKANAAAIERLRQLLDTISQQAPDLAPVSVALRELRHLA